MVIPYLCCNSSRLRTSVLRESVEMVLVTSMVIVSIGKSVITVNGSILCDRL